MEPFSAYEGHRLYTPSDNLTPLTLMHLPGLALCTESGLLVVDSKIHALQYV